MTDPYFAAALEAETIIRLTASVMLLVSVFLRAVRLHVGLGFLRPSSSVTCLAHFIGVALGNVSFLFIYDVTVIIICSLWRADKLFPGLYTLVILRSFDAVALVFFAMSAAALQNTRILVFFFALLALFLWLIIYGLFPALKRLECEILARPQAFAGDRLLLRCFCRFRQSLKRLPWRRQGVLPLVVILSAGSWLFEWLSVYMLLSDSRGASLAVVDRVGGGLFGLTPPGFGAIYSQIYMGVYAVALVLLLGNLLRLLMKAKTGRERQWQ